MRWSRRPKSISTELFYELNCIDVQDLWDNSGKTRYGHVEPSDKAWEMFEEVIDPYLDKMKKSQELHMELEAKNYCLGIIQGLLKYERSSTSEFSDWIPDGPSDFIDTVITEWEKETQIKWILNK